MASQKNRSLLLRCGRRARAERDLALQEQVLDHEVEALMDEGGQGGEEEAE
jgi:hypothetical protein